MKDDQLFYRGWIFANGWSEAVGLGSTFLLGTVAGPALEESESVAAILVGAVMAVLLGTLLEGVLVGYAQGRVLHLRREEISRKSWIIATAAGAGLAWAVGMIPSTLMALVQVSESAPADAPPPALVQYLMAVVLGAVAGPILGLVQWLVLRRHVQRAASWLWANAVAWAVGMPVVFAGMNLVPWEGNAVARTVSIYMVCLIAGLVVGAMHGLVLVRLTRSR